MFSPRRVIRLPRILFLLSCLGVTALHGASSPDTILEKPSDKPLSGMVRKMTGDKDTLFLLESNGAELLDASGHFSTKELAVENGEMVDDPTAGMAVLRFGDKPGKVTIPDGGRITYEKGLTIEAWVYLEQEMTEKDRYGFAEKPGKKWDCSAFGLSLVPGHGLTLDHLGFPAEAIEAAPVIGGEDRKSRPREFYPGRCNLMNSLCKFPAGKWTHVAFTYDPAYRVIRLWIDKGIDREGLNPWYEIATGLYDDDTQPVILFNKARNLRVAQVRMSSIAREIGPAAPVKLDFTDLGYRDRRYVTITPLSPSLPLPCEVTVQNLHPPVLNKTYRFTLDDRIPHRYPIPDHVWRCAESEVVVRLFHEGEEFFKGQTRIMNIRMTDPVGWYVRRGNRWQFSRPDSRPRWWLEEDNVFSYRGKRVFPIGIYHVETNDFDFVADLGFTMIDLIRDYGASSPEVEWKKRLLPFYKKAEARGVTLFADEDVAGRPGEGFLYAFDEPWGYSFAPMRQRYRDLRNARERPAELPALGVQNNWMRYRDTGCVSDILGVDPYCDFRWPLRFVFDATHAAVRETDGLKPVVTVIGNYGGASFRPTYEELRTMSYLGIAGGASSLFYYSWNDGKRSDGRSTNTREMDHCVEDYRKLLQELHAMNEALVVPNAEDGPRQEPARPRGFFPCAKKTADKTYVIIASDLYKTETRTIVYPALAGQALALLHGPSLPGASENLVFDEEGKASVTLPQLGTAVYVTD